MAEDGAQRLHNDLNVVMEKVQLCREIMLESPGIAQDETLAGVVGFLEACRDRMSELIEAGSQGQLSEELFERCFTVNDAVCRTLDAERSGTKIAVNEEEISGKKKEDGNKPLLDLGADNDEDEVQGDVPIRKAAATTVPNSPPHGRSFTKPKAQEDSLLAPFVPPPAPASEPSAKFDPFADFQTAPLDLPLPPTATPSVSEPIPATVTEPATAVPVGGSAEAAAEFDSFFESLGQSK